MLTHPVISSLLNHKWFHFGLWMYLLNLLVYIIFLVFLTSFALVVLNPQSNTCMFTNVFCCTTSSINYRICWSIVATRLNQV